MTIILASLNPVRLVDEVTDRLGALLIDGAKSLSYLVKHLTTLPAGFQVVIALVGVGLVALLVALTLRAFGVAFEEHRLIRPKRKLTWPPAIAARPWVICYWLVPWSVSLPSLPLFTTAGRDRHRRVVSAGVRRSRDDNGGGWDRPPSRSRRCRLEVF